MLRLMIHACVERVNLLLAEVCTTWTNTESHPGPEVVNTVLTEIHDQYQSGMDMMQSGRTAPANLLDTLVFTPDEGRQGAESMIPPVPSSPTRFLTTEPTHTLTQGVPPAGRQDTPPKAMENYPPLPAEAPAQLPPSSKLQVPLTPFTESNASPMATQTTALDSDPPTLAFGDVAPSGTSANEGDAPPVFPHGAIEDSSLCGEILPCPRCTTKAILVECETCSDSYCSECIRTEIDIGLVWCIPCKEDTTTTKQSKRQEPPSTSNSDTSSDRSSSNDSVYT